MHYFKFSPLSVFVASSIAFSSIAQAIEVQDGSTLDITSGALTGEIIVHKGGVLNVHDGASTDGTVIKGTENIKSGAASYNADIQSRGVQNVSGSAINANVGDGGRQLVDNGGKATGTVLQNNSIQDVYAGGYADGTVIYEGGEQYVFARGVANNTVVEGGGMELFGGSADNTTVNAGGLYVFETGTASNTTVNGIGRIEVSGSSDNTILNDNSFFAVKENGIATNTVINDSASMSVYDGATVKGAIINGGKQHIIGSTVFDTIINGGTQLIGSEGAAANTTLESGQQTVYGTITDTTLNGGQSLLFSGARAEGYTKINNDAKMVIYTGAQAEDVTIRGGTLQVAALSDSSAGQAPARVDNLTMDGGDVLFNSGYTYGYAQLNIGELNGSGNFGFNTSLADKAGNFITIGQGTGSFGVIVQDSGKEIADHTDLTVNLINDQGGDIDFALQSTRGASIRAVDGGTYMYVLKQETGKDGLDGNVWYLGADTDDNGGNGGDGGDNGNNGGDGGDGGDNGNNGGDGGDNGNNGGDGGDNGNNGGDGGDNGNNGGDGGNNGNNGGDGGNNGGGGGLVTTPSTDAVLSLANAGLNILRGEMDGLRTLRQGRSSGLQHGEGNVWGHYLGKKSAAETSNGASYNLYQNGMELGGDVVTGFDRGNLVTGGFVSLTGNNVKHTRGGTSSVDSYGLGAYATWYDNSGFYLDGTLKANRLDSKLSARMTNGDMTSGKWHQYGLSMALEAGYTFTPMDSLSVEPFARMTGTTINDADVKLSNGMTAKTGKARSLTTEAGTRVATDLSLGSTTFRPYLSISVEQELAHSNETVINEVNRFKNHQNGTAGKYGAGITVSPAKDVTLYGELNYRQGSYVEEPVQGMAGIRISF